MVMDFWAAKRKAKTLTMWYIFAFVCLTFATAALADLIPRYVVPESYDPPLPFLGLFFMGVTFLVAIYNYLMYRVRGGDYVAESAGGIPIDIYTQNMKERQLINIVQEISLATGLPMPRVYKIPANEINAFAAGLTADKAAIAVTQGALDKLNRDEIQGVLAHEFGHISSGDMVINLRLAAMVMGFLFTLYLGFRMLQGSNFRRSGDQKNGNGLAIAAIVLMAAGAITWLGGSILKAMVSRRREFLADACAVQFTRNPNGIANALRKIAKEAEHDMPMSANAYAHMYFEDRSSLFATHPPIRQRIAAIEGHDL